MARFARKTARVARTPARFARTLVRLRRMPTYYLTLVRQKPKTCFNVFAVGGGEAGAKRSRPKATSITPGTDRDVEFRGGVDYTLMHYLSLNKVYYE